MSLNPQSIGLCSFFGTGLCNRCGVPAGVDMPPNVSMKGKTEQ